MDFTTFNPSSFRGKEDPVGVMDWISEMESAFITCGCTGKLQTTYAMRQFKGIMLCWWNTLRKTVSPNKPLQLTWDKFLIHFMRKFYLTEKMLDLENQFLALTKGNMLVDEYNNAFTVTKDFALRLTPDELTKIDRYAKGLQWEYTVPVK
ncbi:uncharacterized protein LOC111907174 [Lactuca sativa]|uniref:uncharacterized protein LOC111907174 n=1 Tax=Lactuca sativa TaxID=4236 RepID=UPI000CD86C20|nr:uncharacterized protein LOC111907174 [Lactuca sativa]